MALKLSLTAKGLILVSIPILFEIGLALTLINLQRETEIEARQAIKVRDISQRLSIVASKLYQLWQIFTEHKNSREDFHLTTNFFAIYKSTYVPMFNSIRADYAALQELTADRPDFNANVREARKSLDEMSLILENAFNDIRTGHLDQVAQQYQAGSMRVVQLSHQLTNQNFALVARAERDSAEQSAQRHASARQFMIQVLVFLCALNAGFCILLALILQKGIIARVAVMNDNAAKLAANQPLNNLVDGNDEIAELDKMFHSMADTIEDTARMRQELVSMLTHDLRSPLTAIQGSLELLDLQAVKHADQREKKLVQVAQRNSSRMMRLINDLLDIHKIKEGMMTVEPESVCLAEVFEEVALSVAAWIEDNAITLDYDDTALFVYAEREKLERVIFNLVANAIKFSPNGSTITLSARETGRMVQISVADQGKGIPREQLASIFERFQQIESQDEKQNVGSGLGLTICQYLVDLQGGKIWVTSEIKKGSVFHVTLPLA